MDCLRISKVLAERRAWGRGYLEVLRVPEMSLGVHTLSAGGTDPRGRTLRPRSIMSSAAGARFE